MQIHCEPAKQSGKYASLDCFVVPPRNDVFARADFPLPVSIRICNPLKKRKQCIKL
jgi:hypothetical protein